MEQKFDAFLAKYDRFEKSTEKKLDEAIQLIKRVSVVEKNVSAINEKVKSHDSRLDSLEAHKEKTAKTIAHLEQQVNALSKSLKDANKVSDSRYATTERLISDAIETGTRLNQLRINLIPPKKDENLSEIMEKLFTRVGLKLTTNVRFYRLKSGESADTIIVDFTTYREKENFFEHYLKVSRTLKVSDVIAVEDNKDGNIFISHDLSQTQYKICREALKLKSDIIKRVRIHHGYAHIQFENNKHPIRILSLEMLHQQVEIAEKNINMRQKPN